MVLILTLNHVSYLQQNRTVRLTFISHTHSERVPNRATYTASTRKMEIIHGLSATTFDFLLGSLDPVEKLIPLIIPNYRQDCLVLTRQRQHHQIMVGRSCTTTMV